MKHLCIFLFVFNFGLNAAVHSQNQRVSIELKNASIEELIRAIKSQCDMGFLYDYSKTKSVKNITVSMQNVLLSEVLVKALAGTGFVAEIENNMIIIKEAPQNQQKEARTIRGRVTDNAKASLPGVTVLIKGTSIGVVTDTAGTYQITLPDQKEVILVFSFVGMENVEIKVTPERQVYDVIMQESRTALDDVVVTGFFTKNKQSFTGSVKTVSVEEIKAVSNTNLISALAMLTPGLKLVENNQAGSNPNHLPEIVIRGTSSLTTEADVNPNQPIIILDFSRFDLTD
ncbi:STN domain-containing protein [Butyricimonas paravirosa]|uniref:STN domain-containing protein n=1 Tax=Butyricimonas paravirosa TaxID=1472417 RepID=UPI0022E1E671|nr:SusC/RagA family TonB-linked outer membrane protein [Butyricimonas paravirosa]